jgi:hypothetical protein
MKVEELIENFNKTGVFPTDTQLAIAIDGNPKYYDEYDLEMELIDIARNDVNHPYHYAVSGGDKFINL